jgi:hypothetical protein
MMHNSCLAAVETLAADLLEPGMDAAEIVARAWAAGVNPDAMTSMITAAMTLTCNDPQVRATLFGRRTDAHRSNLEYLEDVAETENNLLDLDKQAVDLGNRIQGDLARAREDAAAALREKHEQLRVAATAANETARASAETAAYQAELRYEHLQRVIGDCEAALEVLDEHVLPVLTRALDCVRAAPDDLAEYFEVPYEMARAGRQLPHDGRFIRAGSAA